MKNKIALIITMMTISMLLIIGLQLYWNYQTFKNYERIFKSDSNSALEKTIKILTDIKRDEFATSYKLWMADTTKTIITSRENKLSGGKIFSISDRKPSTQRTPFRVSTALSKPNENIASKDIFIDFFVKNLVYNDLEWNKVVFYTDYLGQSLVNAYKNDTINLKQLTSIYEQELLKRGFKQPFKLKQRPYIAKTFYTANETDTDKYTTNEYKYGFMNFVSVSAHFDNPSLAFLKKMKWVILSSFALTLIILSCFAYTITTMLSQKKLTQLKDGFLNNITHELQTPIATISIAAEAIQDFQVDKNTSHEYLNIIRHQAKNLTSLIDQILNRGKKNGEVVLTKEYFSLSDLLHHCIQQYQPQFNATMATVKIAIENQLCVYGDKDHLSKVISNLLDNAIKYAHQPPTIAIEANKFKHKVIVSITNDGLGIPANYQRRIFENFFRVPSGNLHTIKGYGLGLSYARDISRKHHGDITFKSDSSATVFTLTLPLNTHEST